MITRGADIQVEDGNWSKVHNGIWKALARTPLTGGEFRCLMFLFEKTYGYRKKEDKISLSQWSDGTGMKRQNVWVLLQGLIKRNVIYATSHGPKRAMTWGFNKYHEQWDIASVMPEHDNSVLPDNDRIEESVMLEHDSPVMPQHDTPKPSVMPQHDKSVIPPHERTKEKKEKQLAAAVDDEDGDDATALVRLAYQTVSRMIPPRCTDDGKANLVAALDLIERYGYPACARAMPTLKERNDALIRKNARNAIRAPLPYLRTIMEDGIDAVAEIKVASAVVNFAFEEIAL